MAEDEHVDYGTVKIFYQGPDWMIDWIAEEAMGNQDDAEIASTWLGELKHLNEKLAKTREIMQKIIGPEESGQKAQADITCLADDVSVRIFDAVAQADFLYEQAQRLVLKIKRNSTDYGGTTNT